jgi:8-hydroxy-5-deazaflavin:NADPH oxidoreductase
VAQISIIGTGTMGQAIGTALTRGGHSVEMIGHEDTGTAVSGEIVVLAVPYPALAEIAAARGGQLAGRIVVDITNPVNFQTFDSLTVAADSSATAELAAALPESRVVKAFNTTLAATLASGRVGGTTTTVLIAGDDAGAKAALAEAVRATGMNAIDAGALSRARELEALGFLQITLAAAEKISWTAGFAVNA